MVGSDVTTGDNPSRKRATPVLRRRNQVLAAAAALTLTPLAALAVTTPGEAAPTAASAAAAPEPAARLWAPEKTTGYIYGDRERALVSIDVRLIAGSAPLELWS